MSWREQAACWGVDSIDWMADKLTPAHRDYCYRCPVRLECLESALAMRPGEDFGVYSGTTARERQRIRKERREREAA